MITLTAGIPEPLSRSAASQRPPLRVGLVQHRWRPDAGELAAVLRDGINRAALSAPVDAARPYGEGHPATAVVK